MNNSDIVKEYYEKSKKNENFIHAETYHNKMIELEHLKNLQIQKRQNNIYDYELTSLKDKQRDIYNDFICDYETKRDEIDLKYQNKIEMIKQKYNEEQKEIKSNISIKEIQLINKKLLVLKDKFKVMLKMELFNEAERIKKEIEIENNKLIKRKQNEKIKQNKIKLNNLANKQNKKINEILLKCDKEKNDLKITFNKEKDELIKKFKNQLIDFEMFKKKEIKNNKKKYIINHSDNLFNNSFDKNNITKRLEDDEESLADII